MWKPNKTLEEPLHKQIFEHIKDRIRTGEYKSGYRLSVRKCAADYNVGINTVKSAFENLKAEGLLSAVSRSSTVVANSAWCRAACGAFDWTRIADTGKHIHSSDLFIEACKAIDEGGGLGLNPEVFHPAEPILQAVNDPLFNEMLSIHISDYNRYGFLPLRQEVANYLSRYGILTEVENVVIFGGAFEAYNVICNALLRPGMNVYDLEYSQNTITKNVQSTGANLIGLNIEELINLPRKITRRGVNMLHVTCVNHFVTGSTLTHGQRDALLNVIKELQLPVVERDPFRDIWHEPPPQPLKAGDENELIIYIGTFSQFAHTGSFKLAWAVIPSVIKERICDVSLKIYNTNNITNEIIGYIMLKKGYYEEYIRRLSPKIKERVDKVDAFLKKYFGSGAKWSKKDLSHFIWMQLPGVDENKLLHRCGKMLFAPGTVYGAPSYINMNTLFNPIDEMEEVLQTIAANL